jgi:hypothetical protein
VDAVSIDEAAPCGGVIMSIAGQVLTKIAFLSPDQQRQVLEFIDKSQPQKNQALIDPYGLFAGYDTTPEEIAAARRELWGNESSAIQLTF